MIILQIGRLRQANWASRRALDSMGSGLPGSADAGCHLTSSPRRTDRWALAVGSPRTEARAPGLGRLSRFVLPVTWPGGRRCHPFTPTCPACGTCCGAGQRATRGWCRRTKGACHGRRGQAEAADRACGRTGPCPAAHRCGSRSPGSTRAFGQPRSPLREQRAVRAEPVMAGCLWLEGNGVAEVYPANPHMVARTALPWLRRPPPQRRARLPGRLTSSHPRSVHPCFPLMVFARRALNEGPASRQWWAAVHCLGGSQRPITELSDLASAGHKSA
ncbi:hypothetical protein ABIE67_009974 [Streptomyces sp. V4I8]